MVSDDRLALLRADMFVISKARKEPQHMESGTGDKTSGFRFFRGRSFTREKEEHLRAKPYLDFLAHYDAKLAQVHGSVTIIRCRTGNELPIEQKGKEHMVELLLHEFGTVDAANAAIGRYKASHS
jgi:hypothetical protein